MHKTGGMTFRNIPKKNFSFETQEMLFNVEVKVSGKILKFEKINREGVLYSRVALSNSFQIHVARTIKKSGNFFQLSSFSVQGPAA